MQRQEKYNTNIQFFRKTCALEDCEDCQVPDPQVIEAFTQVEYVG